MRISKTEKQILNKLEDCGALHMSVLDPERFSSNEIGKVGTQLESSGTDFIAIGGTTCIMEQDKKTKAVRESVSVPVITFPSNVWSYTRYADAVFFISLINSRQTYYHSGEPILAAPLIRRLGIEVIPVAYILFEPGKKAGWISDANLLPRDDPDLAVSCALAGEYQGSHFVLMEAGSGAESPIPSDTIKKVKAVLSVPLIVGSGIRTPKQAAIAVRSGADIVDTGNLIVNGHEITEICRSIKDEGKKKARRQLKKSDYSSARAQAA